MYSPVSTKHTYDVWGSMSSSSVRDEQSMYSGTHANRCFQGKSPPSEQLITENFYVGTRNHTPGPGSYKVYASYDASVTPTVKSSSFGTGERLMSSSNSLYQPNMLPSNPGAGAYEIPSTFKSRPRQLSVVTGGDAGPSADEARVNKGSIGGGRIGTSKASFAASNRSQQILAVGPQSNMSSTEQYLRLNLTTSVARLRSLKENVKSSTKMTAELRKASERDYSLHYQRLTKKVEVLQNALDLLVGSGQRDDTMTGTGPEKGHRVRARTSHAAIKPGFNSSQQREFQVQPKPCESPTFYMSDAQWDFGAESRNKTIDMNAFGFSDTENKFKEAVTLARKPVLVGLKPYPARCRDTDFFGDKDGERSITPGVGSYSPAFLPPTDPILKSQVSRATRLLTTTTKTSNGNKGSLGKSW